ncbi:MAG: GAF domain-containing protein [Bacteroidetes bacterium]|nr:GAF domain-containing protein [Bacteroidota bacterium]
MTIHRNTKEIKLNKFFAGVNDSVINTLFKPEYFKDVIEGDIIFETGDSADSLYLLLRGDVKIKFPSSHYISNKIFNNFFGEKELIEKTRRISSAVANSKCLLYLIDEKIFDALLSKSEVIKNNIDNYGEVELPEAESVSTGGIKLTDAAKPISFRATNSPKKEQSKIVTQEFENSSESISETISAIIEQEDSNTEQKLEIDDENLSKDFSDENIKLNMELDEGTEIKIEQPTLEEQEQLVEEPPMEEIDVQIILGVLIAVHSQLTVYDTIQSVINGMKVLTSSEAGEIYLVEEYAGNITRYVNDKGRIKKHTFYKISEGLTGTCLLQKRIINFDNPSEDSRFVSEIDQPGDDRLKYIIYVPLLNTNEEIVAVLQLAHSSKKFTEDEITKVKLISGHTALAIERSKRIEQMIEEEKQDASMNISKFLADNISTPVNVINRYALLLNNEEFSEKVKEIISMLQKQANLFPDIIQAASDYYKSDFELNLENFSLNSYLNSISELLSEYCDSRNINLFKKFSEDAKVKIDPGKLYMALYQAIKNGCDAMEKNGNLYISTEKEGLYANIIISDEGAGIPDEDKDEIFETVFSETKGRNKFGLAITKRIIELHNGQIAFSSKMNEGTTFTFSIPISTDAELIPQFDHSPFVNDDAELKSDVDSNSDTKTE